MLATKNSINPLPNFSHLTRGQKIELRVHLEEKERRRCARDAEYWLFKYARTKDEHDPTVVAKPFPDKPYICEVVRFWLATRMNIIEKSRQMLCSWILCSLYLWDAGYSPNNPGQSAHQARKQLEKSMPETMFELGYTNKAGLNRKSFNPTFGLSEDGIVRVTCGWADKAGGVEACGGVEGRKWKQRPRSGATFANYYQSGIY